MKKLSRKQLILEHYRKVVETEINGVKISVWKPETMQRLPAYGLHEYLESWADRLIDPAEYSINLYESLHCSWTIGNPDYGSWDASVVIRLDFVAKKIDVYIASLLCRPFSEEAKNFYGEHWVTDPMDRLLLMWDSRNYDEKHGFYRKFGFSSVFSEEFIYEVHSDNDIVENINV